MVRSFSPRLESSTAPEGAGGLENPLLFTIVAPGNGAPAPGRTGACPSQSWRQEASRLRSAGWATVHNDSARGRSACALRRGRLPLTIMAARAGWGGVWKGRKGLAAPERAVTCLGRWPSFPGKVEVAGGLWEGIVLVCLWVSVSVCVSASGCVCICMNELLSVLGVSGASHPIPGLS